MKIDPWKESDIVQISVLALLPTTFQDGTMDDVESFKYALAPACLALLI